MKIDHNRIQDLAIRKAGLHVTASHIQYAGQTYHFRDIREIDCHAPHGVYLTLHNRAHHEIPIGAGDRHTVQRIVERNFGLYRDGYTLDAIWDHWQRFPLKGEDRIHEYVIYILTHYLNYPLNRIVHEIEVPFGSRRGYADLAVIHADAVSRPQITVHDAFILIECKRTDTENDEDALDQLKSYISASKRTKYGVVAGQDWTVTMQNDTDFIEAESLLNADGYAEPVDYDPAIWLDCFGFNRGDRQKDLRTLRKMQDHSQVQTGSIPKRETTPETSPPATNSISVKSSPTPTATPPSTTKLPPPAKNPSKQSTPPRQLQSQKKHQGPLGAILIVLIVVTTLVLGGLGMFVFGTGASEGVLPTLAPTAQPNVSYICDCNKTCDSMSYYEAQFQLNECGCSYRDRDGDGVACEG